MTTWKKYYIGDQGPFYYDADRLIEDPDGDFVGSPERAISSDGGGSLESLSITGTPTNDTDVARKQDVDQAVEDLSLKLTTKTKTVVTDVDFSAETVTTENITYVTDVELEK